MASRWSGRVVLVTGASSGIGFAVARKLAQLGMIVVGCARNIDKIKILEEDCKKPDIPGSVQAIRCDVSKEGEIISMFAEIKGQFGGVDVCINNAGFCINCPLIDGDTDGWRQMLNVNVLGLSICTREAIKSMRERNVDDGHVIHVSSTAGHSPPLSPPLHFYSATKFAVRALTEGLRQELREIKSHIRITSISPSWVRTEFGPRFLGQEKMDEIFKSLKPLEADDIADAIIYALQAPPHVQVHDIIMRPTEQKL